MSPTFITTKVNGYAVRSNHRRRIESGITKHTNLRGGPASTTYKWGYFSPQVTQWFSAILIGVVHNSYGFCPIGSGKNNHVFSHATRKISYITHLKQSTQWYLQIFIASLNGFRLSSCLSLWRKWITSWKKSCNLISWACLFDAWNEIQKYSKMVVWWWWIPCYRDLKKSPTS